jgi:hypothetical protein
MAPQEYEAAEKKLVRMVHLQYARREPGCHHVLNKKHKKRRRDALKNKAHLYTALEDEEY